jgi:hypothetical protein
MTPEEEQRYFLQRFEAHLTYLIGIVNIIGTLIVVLLAMILVTLLGWLQ